MLLLFSFISEALLGSSSVPWDVGMGNKYQRSLVLFGIKYYCISVGFGLLPLTWTPQWLSGKEYACNAGVVG